ncbi:MAG TPA: PAS domain-containing protein [Candidatus Hydrogenedentes bacterium]|nr:PAS domain-containing protein [Candidatus Hydrogenedentota bacterium]HOL77841.1 PAS domain-containing protein [Candidatus Hydrogenedentota bacterium]HPO86186.1 PAS domain-containing protein [Candidatus Hydrogenedentota bacterium]
MIIHHEFSDDLVETLCDAFPAPVLLVDEDVRIYGYNRAAEEIVGEDARVVLQRRGGEVMHCLHAESTPAGCGKVEECKECVLREAVGRSLQTGSVFRARHRLLRKTKDGVTKSTVLVSASPVTFQDKRLSLVVLEDVTELMELRRLIPICSVCKKVRTDQDYWVQLESYLSRHLDVAFSHGLCRECYEKEVQRFRESNSKVTRKGDVHDAHSPDLPRGGSHKT